MVNALHLAEKGDFTPMGGKMSKWMDHVLGPNFRHYGHTDNWTPAINLCEHERYYCVVVDLAGVQAAKIDLRAEGGVLVLAGDRAMPSEPKSVGNVRLHLMEIDQGPFHREIQLPEGVDVDAIEAFYRNGYLWIRIPKTS